MNIRYSSAAVADLEAIRDYIADHNERAAYTTITKIMQSISFLEMFPLIGREGRQTETRELVIPSLPYIVIYTIPDSMTVEIEAVIHTRRQFPDGDQR